MSARTPDEIAARFRLLLQQANAGNTKAFKSAQQIARRYGLCVIRPVPLRKPWTPEETDRLRTLYPDTPIRELLLAFPGRRQPCIYAKAQVLKIRRSDAFIELHGQRIRHDAPRGVATRFKPGNVPTHSRLGIPASGRARDTLFKPGQRAHNWVPIGTERVNDDGYRERKATDTGQSRYDWLPVHRLLWEEHHGPIPPKHSVAFRNADKTDIRIENLELISFAEQMRRNSVTNLPEPVRELVRLRSRLTRTIRKRKKEARQ